jgi:hypothetical protein
VLGEQACGDVDGVVLVVDGVGRKATVDDAHAKVGAREQVVETREHVEEVQVSRAQPDHFRARRNARVCAAGARAVARDQARDESAVAVDLIRVRYVLQTGGRCKADAHALRVQQLDVLRDAAGQIAVRAVQARIEHRDGDAAPGHGQTRIEARQLGVARDAFRARRGEIRVGGRLESAVAVDGAHRGEARDAGELPPRRRHGDHWQRAVTRAADDAVEPQVCEVCLARLPVIDDGGVDVAVIGGTVEQDGKFRV